MHVPDFANRDGEALGDGNALALLGNQLVRGFLHGWNCRHAFALQLADTGRQGRPEQSGKQEGWGYGLALFDASVGAGQGQADQLTGVLRVTLERGGCRREQWGEQVVFEQ